MEITLIPRLMVFLRRNIGLIIFSLAKARVGIGQIRDNGPEQALEGKLRAMPIRIGDEGQ